MEPKSVVESGYDVIAKEYQRWSANDVIRTEFLSRFMKLIPEKGKVLDLGCGAGVACKYLSDEKFTVFGADLSQTQIDMVLHR
jgi:cyclopropane fatty-acyl-phospholipid synthase-like methyltransferase